MKSMDARVDAALEPIESAVSAQDLGRLEEGYLQLAQRREAELSKLSARLGPRLAALLPEMPTWHASVYAILVGALVEWHADPAACAAPILAGLREGLARAMEFEQLWASRFGAEEDLPGTEEIDEEVEERLGSETADTWGPLYEAWVALHHWEMAAVAVLADPGVRHSLPDRDELVELTRALEPRYGDLQCVQRSLLLLDDEPLLVLDRASRRAFRMRMSGVADSYQLQTLLAAVLIGGRHLPGRRPARRSVKLCSDGFVDMENLDRLPVEEEWFTLSEPSGRWIRSGATPSRIPVVDGVRHVVLDPPVFPHVFRAVRFLPRVPGRLELEEVIEPARSAPYFEHVRPLMPADEDGHRAPDGD